MATTVTERPQRGSDCADLSEIAVGAVTAAYGFGGHRTIVDIAGGHGRLLAGILSANPAASGILFDLPHVVAGAEPLLCKHGVAERVRIVEGSFFDAVLEGGDLYVLKNLIHDWPDDKAQQILKTLRAATPTGTTVLLVECVIPPHDRDALAKWSDLEMLVVNAGRERTGPEYQKLLQQGWFSHDTYSVDRLTVQHCGSQRGLMHRCSHNPARSYGHGPLSVRCRSPVIDRAGGDFPSTLRPTRR